MEGDEDEEEIFYVLDALLVRVALALHRSCIKLDHDELVYSETWCKYNTRIFYL